MKKWLIIFRIIVKQFFLAFLINHVEHMSWPKHFLPGIIVVSIIIKDTSHIKVSSLRGRSQTTFTREVGWGGGRWSINVHFFVNVHKVENVKRRGVVQKSEIYVVRERPLTPISNLTKKQKKCWLFFLFFSLIFFTKSFTDDVGILTEIIPGLCKNYCSHLYFAEMYQY